MNGFHESGQFYSLFAIWMPFFFFSSSMTYCTDWTSLACFQSWGKAFSLSLISMMLAIPVIDFTNLLDLKFYLWESFKLQVQFLYKYRLFFQVTCFFSWVNCVSIYHPFHWSYQIYWHKIAHNIPYYFFNICRICNDCSSIITNIWEFFFYFFFLVVCLQVYKFHCFFQKFLFHYIFFTIFMFSILLSFAIFIISFLLLTLCLICSSFSNF